MIPKAIKDAVDERRRLREHCAICERTLYEEGAPPYIFWTGSGDEIRHAHVRCVDWSSRDYPGRDLVKRIRATRRRIGELDHTLALAETIARRLAEDWERASPAVRARLAAKYFRLVDRIHAVVSQATGGW